MAAEDLPSEFDVVILGTGLAESVVAAAFSRVGQRVLHLDRQSYYAGKWASFTFNGLLSWIDHAHEESKQEEAPDWLRLLEEGEELIYLSNSDSASVSNLQVFCFTSEEDEEQEEGSTPGPPITTEAGSAGVKEEDEPKEIPEEPNGDEEQQTAQTAGAEPETDRPSPSPEQSQSEPTKAKISYARLVKEGRRFNIDLVSKFMYSRGSLVDLLIKSNVSRYAEFKNATRILTYRRGKVEQVPCSRADVFASRQLSVVEKRKLMRFLTSCVEDTEDQQAYSGRPYLEFLRSQQLGDNLEHFLLHSIAMVTEDAQTEEGLASTRHFLHCLGRYGNTPFLFPVYGLGEIPQCFCRMCAVFGGIYCLRHSVNCLVVDKDTNRCKAVIDSRGQRIGCRYFVAEEGYFGEARKKVATPTRFLSRAVLITDASILPSESDQQVSLVTVPPVAAGRPAVRMVELCSSTMTCMSGTHLVHLTCQSVGSAYEDLSPLVTEMFRTPESRDQDSPSVLWCLYFNMADGSGLEVEGHDLPSNVHLCSGPDGALGHDRAVRQAESIFQKILPEEDFCPPAPNPEDIVYDGDGNTGEQDKKEELEEAGLEEKKGQEAGLEENGREEAGLEEKKGQEAGLEETGQEEAGLEENGREEAGLEEKKGQEAGLEDQGLLEE